ncbi:MAG: glycosyltransferase family A protein [Ferruginibacter sp.]
MPLLSVLTTSYNREEYLAEAIESVLASSFTDFEYIIVDDGSTENILAIAKYYEKVDSRIKVYVNEKNLGDYPNRNKAAGYAKGKYIKYLDTDDIMYRHCLEVMMYSMEKYPEAGFGLSAKGDEKEPYPVCISPREIYIEHFGDYGHFNRAPGSAIIKRQAFEEVGGFSGARYTGDIELWFTLAQKYSMVKFPLDLYWARSHNNQEKVMEKKTNKPETRKALIKKFLESPYCPIDAQEIKLSFGRKIKQSIGRII